MATYVFRAADGEVVERHYPMKSAPPLGKSIRVNGKAFRRILSLPANGTAYDSDCYPKVSKTLPQLAAGAAVERVPRRRAQQGAKGVGRG